MKYGIQYSMNKKGSASTLNKARLAAIKYLNEDRGEVKIYQGEPSPKKPVYGIVGFDVARYEYYWIRGKTAYYLNWITGATQGQID